MENSAIKDNEDLGAEVPRFGISAKIYYSSKAKLQD
jgi:hypothetical protein